MEKIFAPEQSRELIRGWLIHARKGWKKQEEAARRLESQYRRIGIASVTLSAVVGASLFSSLEKEHEPWITIITGIVSITASVLASLLTFQRYEERTEKHRAAGVGYKGALRALERMHTVVQEQGLDGLDQQKLTEINDQLDVLEKVAPVVPDDINVAVERRYEVYKFEDEAEKLRSGQEEER
jgi:hypothetical protein